MNTRLPTSLRRGRWSILPLLVCLSLSATGAVPRRVLLIYSYGSEYAPFDSFSGYFRTELIREMHEPVEFYEVSLELARYGDAPGEGPFADYLLATFSERRLDVLVPIGGPAVRFAQKHREQLFPATPMLLAAVDERHVREASLTSNDTVVAVRNDPARIVETILFVAPQTTNVCVVIGSSPLEQFWLGELRRAFQPYTNRVSFVWFSELPFAEMLKRCAALPPRSAIFHVILAVDAEGTPHVEERALADLRAVATAPIFGLHDTQLGRGVVGGPLMEIGRLSRTTALVAARILRGEPPGEIRTPAQSPGAPTFDGRELGRWDIHERLLPPDSRVMFREPTAWERYRGRIIAITSLCLSEAALITLLVANLLKRRRAEASLVESRNRLRSILDTAVEGIITLDGDGIIESVNAATERIFGYSAGELIGRDVAMLMPSLLGEEDGQELANGSRARQPRIIGIGREVSGRRKDGSVFPLELAVSEIFLANRRVFTGFVRDITERKQAEHTAREFGGRLLHAQEAERARLARELHDDITQRLARLAIDAGRVERASGVDLVETMRGVRDGLVRLSEDVHSLSYQLHPALLEDLGLIEALKGECDRFGRQESMAVETDLDGVQASIPKDAGLCLFRVAQEALRNVARHANARSVRVSMRSLDGGMQLAVADTGVGFEPAQNRHRPSLGLASMRERVRLLDGEFDVESAPGHGTTVLAWIPLNGKSA